MRKLRRKEQKEEDDLEARIKLMKRLSKKRLLEDVGMKPGKKARIEVDWREQQPGVRLEDEGVDHDDEDEEVSEEHSEVGKAEDNIDKALRILESDEEQTNVEPKVAVDCRDEV